MKSILTLSLLLISQLYLADDARAQKDLFIGIKGGLSIPSLRAGESENIWNKNYESRIGPYFGAYTEIQLTRYLSFQPEINYAAEGGKRNGIQPMTIPGEFLPAFQQAFSTDKDYLFAGLNTVSRVNYIQLPLLMKFNYPLAAQERLKVFVQAGPYIGYLVAAKQLVKAGNLRVYLDEDGKTEIPSIFVNRFFGNAIDTAINARNELHKLNIGVQGGLGLSYDIARGKVFVEGGGNIGFLYIQKGDEHGKNNIGAGTVLVGYAYNIRKRKA